MSDICFQDIIAGINCLITISWLLIALFQLRGIKEQISIGVSNQAKDSLKIVLEIETQLNSRKLEFDKANKALAESDEKNNEILSAFVETTKESYFNAMDRLCFCIQKGYVDENEYRPEYRNMIHDTVKTFEASFGASSPYNHIKQINEKWQES